MERKLALKQARKKVTKDDDDKDNSISMAGVKKYVQNTRITKRKVILTQTTGKIGMSKHPTTRND